MLPSQRGTDMVWRYCQAMKEAILRSEVAVANLTQTLQTATPIARSGGSESEGGKGEEGGEERAPGWASSLVRYLPTRVLCNCAVLRSCMLLPSYTRCAVQR